MKYFHLIWAALFRRKTRTFLTLASILAAFLLFGMLDGVRQSFSNPSGTAEGATRLQTASRLSFIETLPMSLGPRIAMVDGVEAVTYANWFGGAYQEASNQVFSFAVAPNYLDLFPEANVSAEERERFANTRTGLLVGQSLVERFGWKVGDQVPLLSNIFPNSDGSKVWTFDIVGIMDSEDDFITASAFLHWELFDESTPYSDGQVGWYVSRIDDVAAAGQRGDGEPAVQEVAIDLGVIEQDRDEASVLRAQAVQAEAGVNAGLELHRDCLVVTHVIVGTPHAAAVLAGLDRPSSCLDPGFDRCDHIVGPAALVVDVELRRTVPARVLQRADDASVR